MVVDIDKVCRLCMELSSNSIYYPNTSNGQSSSLSDDLISRIFECTSLKVALGDGLPESICGSCLRLIDKFLLFRKMCWEVDNKLRQHLFNNKETDLFSSLPTPVRLDDDQVHLSLQVKDSPDIKPEQISSDDEENENHNDSDESDEDYLPSPSKSASKLTKQNYNCDTCEESFNKVTELKKHKEDEHPKAKKARPVMNCHYCNKPFKQLKRYNDHIKAHENFEDDTAEANVDKSKKSSNDSDSDFQAQAFEQSKNEVEDGTNQPSNAKSIDGKKKKFRKVYDCEYCDQVFHSHAKYTQHEIMHTGEKKYNCSDCSRSFTHKHSLIGHIKEQHTGEVNFTCDVCGRGFVHQSTFNIHKKTHSTEKPLKCPDCGKCFTQMKNLRVHRQIHSASRSHTCQVCGKSFNFLKTLKVHLVLHSGEKPYVCTYCGKGFAQSAPLKTHTRIHTGERPYECTLCPSSFSTNNALKCHILKHSGEAPYSCEVCNRGFGRKKDMVAHQEEAHKVFIGLPNVTTNVVSVSTKKSLPDIKVVPQPNQITRPHSLPNVTNNVVSVATKISLPDRKVIPQQNLITAPRTLPNVTSNVVSIATKNSLPDRKVIPQQNFITRPHSLPNVTNNVVSVATKISLPDHKVIPQQNFITAPHTLTTMLIVPDGTVPVLSHIPSHGTSHESPPPLAPLSHHPQMTAHLTHLSHHTSSQLQQMTHHTVSTLHPPNCMPHQPSHYNTSQRGTDSPGTDCSSG